MKRNQRAALAALAKMGDLWELVNDYLMLQREIQGSNWVGPDANDWKLDQYSNEDSVELFWTGWDGCHCHGHTTTETMTISVKDLLANPDELRAAHKIRVAEEARKAEEAKAKAEAAARGRQKADDLKKLSELTAKYPDALPK
jgi:hypothetical protein